MALMGDREERLGTIGIIAYIIGAILTFAVGLAGTWGGQAPFTVKVYNSVFVNLFDAAVWPVAWLMWSITYLTGFDVGSPSFLTDWIF